MLYIKSILFISFGIGELLELYIDVIVLLTVMCLLICLLDVLHIVVLYSYYYCGHVCLIVFAVLFL